jgi:hypothetical protein
MRTEDGSLLQFVLLVDFLGRPSALLLEPTLIFLSCELSYVHTYAILSLYWFGYRYSLTDIYL